MEESSLSYLAQLSVHLEHRRPTIIEALRRATIADPQQTTGETLSRSQFYDHLPEILSAFEVAIMSPPGSSGSDDGGNREQSEEAKHGLHRWQQGFRLSEVLREWGALHLCLIEEFNYFSSAHGQSALEALAFANKQLVVLIHDAIDESTSQYVRLEKESASGRVRDLERALTELGDLEKQRAELIHQAVHDLGGNVQAVTSAATVLTGAMLPESEREQLGGVVKRSVRSLHTMLTDLMGLARLEAGQERPNIVSFDAAILLTDLCSVVESLAVERGLKLQVFGPDSLPVQGDSEKVHRIAQNLILNAIKYTVSGHVTVRWGTEEANKWWFIVKDTGPGITFGSAAPMLAALVEATETAEEASDSASANGSLDHESSPVDINKPLAFPSRDSGEGIGLSIVKRLCELIDAILEVKASPEDGTTFRVELPTRYDRRSP